MLLDTNCRPNSRQKLNKGNTIYYTTTTLISPQYLTVKMHLGKLGEKHALPMKARRCPGYGKEDESICPATLSILLPRLVCPSNAAGYQQGQLQGWKLLINALNAFVLAVKSSSKAIGEIKRDVTIVSGTVIQI